MKTRNLFKLLCLMLALVMVAIPLAACEGAQGPQGPAGEQGEQGPAGQNGLNGINGNVWSVGEGAPAATAATGDLYLDTATSNVYRYDGSAWTLIACIKGEDGATGAPGATGATGSTGATGAPGAAGANGNQWYTGEGAPNGITGMTSGDLYLDLNTGDVYKYTTAWNKIGCIKGETGEEGAPGEPGEPGAPGEEGAPGEPGAPGAAGTPGNTWTAGEGAPTATANNGDMYYDQTTGSVYQYHSDAWVLISKPMTEKDKKIAELLDLKQELRVNEDGSFKVLMFSDIHFYSGSDLAAGDSIKYINDMVDKEEPDLVLFAGDNWWDCASEEEFRGYIEVLVGHIEEKKIPWAHVYGNHDDENEPNGWTKSIHQSVQQRICEEFEYCVSKAGEEYLSGTGNYVLPVLSYDGTKIAYNIWALDSGSYAHYFSSGNLTDEFTDANGQKHTTTFYSKYEGIQRDQVDWYVQTSQLLEEYNGEKIPAMMYFHIPLQETYTAWKSAYLYGVNGTNRTDKQFNNMQIIGTKSDAEGVCAPTYNAGLFDAAVERGDVKLMAYGHDHIHDFSVVYQGINLSYIPAITTRSGVTGANNALMGGRVVEFDANGNITTHMSYVSDLYPDSSKDTTSPLLNMVIGSNGSVTNGATGRQELTYHNQGSADTTVIYDETLGQNVVHFTGHSTTPSVYNLALPVDKYTAMLADGFYFEVMFKLDAVPTAETGIIDSVHGGGFGLQVLNGGTLRMEMGRGSSGYEEYKITNAIAADTWYHVVFCFDGSTTALYLNGVKIEAGQSGVTHSAKTDAYRQPNFENRVNEEYLCIGGCAVAWRGTGVRSNGEKGMTGSIAVANLSPGTITASEALALYQNSALYNASAN